MALTRDFTDMIVTRGTGKKLSQDITEITSTLSDMVTLVGEKIIPEADDTPRIQRALDKKGIVRIPNGTFEIGKILIVKEGTTVELSPSTILKRINGIYCVFTNGTPIESYYAGGGLGDAPTGYTGNGNIIIKGGTIDCNGTLDQTPCMGITFSHAKNILIEGVTIKDIYAGHHIEINSTDNAKIINCKFDKYTDSGGRPFSEMVQIDGAFGGGVFPLFGADDNTVCNNITVENCDFKNGARGIGTHNAGTLLWHNDIKILNNRFSNMTERGIHCYAFKVIHIANNTIESCNAGISLLNSYDVLSEGNIIKTITTIGYEIDNTNTVTSNNDFIKSCTGQGVIIKATCYDVKFNGSTITNGSDMGVNLYGYNNEFLNCTISNNLLHGVFVHDTTAKGNRISNCKIVDNSRTGVLFSLSCSGNFVANCFIANNNAAGGTDSNLSIVSTSTNNEIVNNRFSKSTSTIPTSVNIASGCTGTIARFNNMKGSGTVTFQNSEPSTVNEYNLTA
jgi:hypothetical protein